jgi:hypothetical protein
VGRERRGERKGEGGEQRRERPGEGGEQRRKEAIGFSPCLAGDRSRVAGCRWQAVGSGAGGGQEGEGDNAMATAQQPRAEVRSRRRVPVAGGQQRAAGDGRRAKATFSRPRVSGVSHCGEVKRPTARSHSCRRKEGHCSSGGGPQPHLGDFFVGLAAALDTSAEWRSG